MDYQGKKMFPRIRGAIVVAAALVGQVAALADCQKIAGAQCQGAKLNNVVWRNADLSGGDFRNANLEGANLEGARLKGADLRGANLKDRKSTRLNSSHRL